MNRLTSEGQSLNTRLDRLRQADGAACPLCGQPLTAEHRDEIMAQLTAERDEKRAQYRDCGSEIEALNAASRAKEAEIEGWAGKLKHRPALQQRLGALAEAERLAEEAEAALPGEQRQLSQLETRLASGEFGHELRRQLTELERQRASIGYDPASHADTRTQLESYAEYERGHTQLEFARISLPEAQKIRADTAARLDTLRASLRRDEDKLKQNSHEIAALEDLARGERELRARVDSMRTEAQALNERRPSLSSS